MSSQPVQKGQNRDKGDMALSDGRANRLIKGSNGSSGREAGQ